MVGVALRAEVVSLEGMGSPRGGVWVMIRLSGEEVRFLARLTHGSGKNGFIR